MRPHVRALAIAVPLLLGCGRPRNPGPAHAANDPRCITSDAAEHLRKVIDDMLASADSIDQASVDSLRLTRSARGTVRIEHGAALCRAAAVAYARQAQTAVSPVVPVVVVSAGDRLVVVDPTSPPGSEWALAIVFTRKFRLLSRFGF
jgi:hypothetical protein